MSGSDDADHAVHRVDVEGYEMGYLCPTCGRQMDDTLESGGFVQCWFCRTVYEVEVTLTER